MKRMLLALALTIAMAFTLMPSAASAAPAYTTAFGVSVTYQNVGAGPATISFDFFTENSGTAITVPAATLAQKASTSLSIASVSAISGSFKGSAVLSSNQQVIATIVQFDPSGAVKNRPLSNGFSATDGSAKQLVATVLKNTFNNSTYFSVQNTAATAIDVTVAYYAVGSTTPTFTDTSVKNLPANAAHYFDAGKTAQLGSSFNGSAVVTAKLAGTATDANVVVTVDELSTVDAGSKSFEGASISGPSVYMPSAFCNFNGLFNSAYAIQNADTAPVNIQIRYKITGQADLIDGPHNIVAGGKYSAIGCAKMPNNSIGSAVIESIGGTGKLVAVGKVGGANVTSAFLGTVQDHGSANIALPYIRWAPDSQFNPGNRQRGNIAIQNIGSTTATNVVVTYIDKDGVTKGTQTFATLAPGAKVSSNASAAGALDPCGRFGETDAAGQPACSGGVFGGGAIVTAGGNAQLAVVVRIGTGNPGLAGEDYNGINI